MMHGAGSAATAVIVDYFAARNRNGAQLHTLSATREEGMRTTALIMRTGETVGNQYPAYAGPFHSSHKERKRWNQ
jgi:hypothetical protein